MITGELGRIYTDGETIFREDDPGDVMCVVQFGKVSITKRTPAGEVTIATLGQGDIFGEMALFDKEPRSATAVACGDARVLSVDKRKFFTAISRDPTIAFRLLQSMSGRVRRLNEEVIALRKQQPAKD
ncbi:cyclic nucleotide-binding domain-containing protein [bacterium]|nr:cyclic nucleotide-binding domain-containing protein [bacterium]